MKSTNFIHTFDKTYVSKFETFETKFAAIKLYQRINKTMLNFHQFQNIKRSTLHSTGVVKRTTTNHPFHPHFYGWN